MRTVANTVPALAFLAVTAGAAQAQPEPRSVARETITIRASVKPTFSVAATDNQLSVSSNSAGAFRYHIIMQPAQMPAVSAIPASLDPRTDVSGLRDGGTGAKDQQRLLLIVPD